MQCIIMCTVDIGEFQTIHEILQTYILSRLPIPGMCSWSRTWRVSLQFNNANIK